jgi:hypothetical protein
MAIIVPKHVAENIDRFFGAVGETTDMDSQI